MTVPEVIAIKQIYEPSAPEDGLRVLVDRLRPRGLARKDAAFHHWLKDIGPSHKLRRWFGHQPERLEAFRMAYEAELRTPESRALLTDLRQKAKGFARLTLLYSARDTERNQAVVVADLLGHDADL
ncbi:MAG: DUF488 family protein [Pseudomonadota bacterium]